MKVIYSATIYGEPVPYPRPRPRFDGVGYINPKSRKISVIAKEIAYHKKNQTYEGPVRLHVEFYKTIPKSWTKAKKESARCGVQKAAVKPDLDNYIKTIKDALTKAGVWKDDCQVCVITAWKEYADEPFTRIEVSTHGIPYNTRPIVKEWIRNKGSAVARKEGEDV